MKKGLDAYKLKLIAVVFMILDHFYSFLSYQTHESLNWPELPWWTPLTTRFVFPLFIYLMIDGFYHTRSRVKYLLRLITAALIMWAGTSIIYLYFDKSYFSKYSFISFLVDYNMFTMLGLMFAFIWCLDNIKRKNHIILNVLLTLIVLAASVFAGGLILYLPIPFIIWLFYGSKTKQCIGILVYSMIYLMFTVSSYYSLAASESLFDFLCMNGEWALFTVIPFILAYNGERGKNTKFSKYFFYFIYPVHFWIIFIARFILEK